MGNCAVPNGGKATRVDLGSTVELDAAMREQPGWKGRTNDITCHKTRSYGKDLLPIFRQGFQA
jgi:hypothetical protein